MTMPSLYESKPGPFDREMLVSLAHRAGLCCLLMLLLLLVLVGRGSVHCSYLPLGSAIRQVSTSRPDSPEPGPKSSPMGWVDFASTPTLGLIDSSSQNSSKSTLVPHLVTLRPHGGVVVPWVPPGPFLMKEHGGPWNKSLAREISGFFAALTDFDVHRVSHRLSCDCQCLSGSLGI